ncbi:XRCC4-like factor-domain-containing protein [Tirmania nivea]|nr:XRCC4-like factor-domain-containing protein [Tirmania nivea]
MALNPDSHWYPLVVTAQLPVHSPPLLIQRSFTNNTYSVYLTDLTYLWGETLSRREIVQRALNEDTSIDPSEDASQMRILLEKLKEALSLQGGDDDNDSIDVDIQAVPSKSSPSAGAVMQLNVTYGLPEPLEPLFWTFKLQPLPQTRLTKMLLLPLISLTSLHSTEVQTLVRVIKDKDIVLEKMKDSLEDSKISVASILGGGASRRRGLEKFDEKRWRAQILESKAGDSSRPAKIVRSFFGMEGRRDRSASDEGFGQEWEEVVNRIEEDASTIENEKDWWDEIEATQTSRQKKKRLKGFESDETESDSPVRKVSNKSDTSRRTREMSSKNLSRIDAGIAGIKGKKRLSIHSDDEDEFEVQPHSPRRSKSASKVKSPPPSSPPPARKPPVSGKAKSPERNLDESTTEGDDDLDIPALKSPPRARCAKSSKPAPISSPPPNQLSKSPTPPSPLLPLRELTFSTESRTISRKPSKPLSDSSTPVPSSPLVPASPPQGRPEPRIGGIEGGIGKIGGKKAVSRESPQPRSPHPEVPDTDEEKNSDGEQQIPVKSGMSLGKIGGKVGGKINGKISGIIGGKKRTRGIGEDVEVGEATKKVDLPTRGGTPQTLRENHKADIKSEVPSKREPSYDPMDEEAADRKRRQLQQELEARQKVPVKKKRKF